jgi:hypothetical protein
MVDTRRSAVVADAFNGSGADWIDAEVHPPRLVTVAQRVALADGSVRVVSHVELWPWRTVVRGVYAHEHRDPRTGSSNAAQESVAPWRFEPMNADWFAGWLLGDDTGTLYRRTGAGIGGAAGDLWASFNIEFASPVPRQASRLTIHTRDGDRIEVAI